MKICNKCKQKLPISDFYVRKARKGRPISECKKCATNRVKEGNRKRKIEILNAYRGCFCKCCGVFELSFLSIDHINNDGAIHRREIFGNNGSRKDIYSWLRRNNFPIPDRLQVLCFNCQWGKRLNKGVCPHQVKGVNNENISDNAFC